MSRIHFLFGVHRFFFLNPCRYREIWEIQKDAFIRRYQRLNPPVSSFDADIARLVLLVVQTMVSDLVGLWVIKIKSPCSFAHVVRRDHMKSARNAVQAARTCARFVYSRIKITKLPDYQT